MSLSVAEALLEIKALHFQPKSPVTFKSGIVSPVYLDNRKIIGYPQQWRIIIEAFAAYLQANEVEFDAIAGVATAGIPHSAALAFILNRPTLYVRKATKSHGLLQLIEGAEVAGQRVVLVEDMVTTGSSSLKAIQALQDREAVVSHCLCITTYGFATQAFADVGIVLAPLVEFSTLLRLALDKGYVDEETRAITMDWYRDPFGWAKRYGFE